MPQTLPQALLRQAHTRGSAIALRFKRLGIWHERSWSAVADEVSQLAAALHQLDGQWRYKLPMRQVKDED